MKPEKITAAVTSVIQQTLGEQYTARLIGSRADGTARNGSDYDFLIEGPEAIPITTMAELKMRLNELPTLAKIDLVDASTASEDFLAVTKST